MGRRLLLTGVMAIAASAGGVLAQDATRADAASMRAKLAAIAEHGAPPAGKPAASSSKPTQTRPPIVAGVGGPLTTTFTDREVNAYFAIDGPEILPTGLEKPTIAIDEGGIVRARATIDLDVVLKTKERNFFDPLSWMHGKTDITAAGLLRAADGRGTLQMNSATLNGVTVPKLLLQEIVNYYTKTPERPEGFSLDQPFDLPARIRAIDTRRGQATIIQQ